MDTKIADFSEMGNILSAKNGINDEIPEMDSESEDIF